MTEDLPAPWPDVLDALRSITHANGEMYRLVEMIRARHDADIDDLRRELRSLRRSVEAYTA